MAISTIGQNGLAVPFITSADASISGLTVGKGGGSGATNTAVGASALNGGTTASQTTAVGYQALQTLTNGTYNTAVGYQALNLNSTNNHNTAVGKTALAACVGDQNTAVGSNSLRASTSGTSNTGLGFSALTSNTTGAGNTAIGDSALQANTTASNNTAVGYQALNSNTTANGSVAIGFQALYTSNRTSDTSTYITAVGYQAGFNNTTGQLNTFVGSQAGYAATTGKGNTFIGVSQYGNGAGSAVTTGGSNTIIGGYNGNTGGLDIRTSSNYVVLSDGDGNPRLNIDGSGNITVGASASQLGKFSADIGTVKFTDGTPSAFLNWRSNQATGRPCIQVQNLNVNNDAAFRTAGWDGTNSQYWTFGQNINSAQTNFDFCYNSVAGSQTSGSGTCYVRFTNSGQIYNTSGTYGTISDIKLKENIVDASPKLSDLMQLKVRNFNLKADETKAKHLGFIAQEMQEVFPACVEAFDDIDPDTKEKVGETLTVKTAVLIPMLVKAIQELKAEVDSLKQQLGK